MAHTGRPVEYQGASGGWGKPKQPHTFEFCENGAKATMWELTRDRCTPDFFAAHPVSELLGRPGAGAKVVLVGDAGDGVDRRVGPLTVTPFALPDGCVSGYYPEMNPLAPLWYHDTMSKTPASQGLPVRIEVSGVTVPPITRKLPWPR